MRGDVKREIWDKCPPLSYWDSSAFCPWSSSLAWWQIELQSIRFTLWLSDSPTGLQGFTWPGMMTLLFTPFSLNVISSYKLVGNQQIGKLGEETKKRRRKGGKTQNIWHSTWHTNGLYRTWSPPRPFLTPIPLCPHSWVLLTFLIQMPYPSSKKVIQRSINSSPPMLRFPGCISAPGGRSTYSLWLCLQNGQRAHLDWAFHFQPKLGCINALSYLIYTGQHAVC